MDSVRVVEAFFSLVEGGYKISCDQNESPLCVMSRDGDSLVVLFESERLILTTEELLLLWNRFQEWKVRKDPSLVFSQFFEDMNRWGDIGVTVIREVVVGLMFAASNLSELDVKRREDGLERIAPLLPRRLYFDSGKGGAAYAVDFRLEAGELVFEKNGHSKVISRADIGVVWSVFAGWWVLPRSRELRSVLEFEVGKAGDRAFFAFELACLMQEAEMKAAFPKTPGK